jgi:hypothetical protein
MMKKELSTSSTGNALRKIIPQHHHYNYEAAVLMT